MKGGKDIRREQNLKIYLSILAIILTIVGGGLCYSFLESWSFMDAIYFAAMTTLVCHLALAYITQLHLLPCLSYLCICEWGKCHFTFVLINFSSDCGLWRFGCHFTESQTIFDLLHDSLCHGFVSTCKFFIVCCSMLFVLVTHNETFHPNSNILLFPICLIIRDTMRIVQWQLEIFRLWVLLDL